MIEIHALHAAAALSSSQVSVADGGTGIGAGLMDGAAVKNLTALVQAQAYDTAAVTVTAHLAPATAAADRVSDAMLAALTSLLNMHHETPDDDALAVTKLEKFTAAFAAMCEAAAAGVGVEAGSGGVAARAAGGAVPAAFYCVADAGVGAVVALQAWAAAVAPRKGSGKKGKGGGAGVAGNATLIAAVKAAAAAVAAGLVTVTGAATPHPGTEEVEVAALAEAMDAWAGPAPGGGGGAGGRLLQVATCKTVAKKVVVSQRVTLNALRAHGKSLAAHLNAVAVAGGGGA
jgi:hypothetical protein